jgi:hypothetical protein
MRTCPLPVIARHRPPLYERPEFHPRTGEQTSVERRRRRTPYRARTPASVSSLDFSPLPSRGRDHGACTSGVSVLYGAYISRTMLRPGAVAYRRQIESSIEGKWT